MWSWKWELIKFNLVNVATIFETASMNSNDTFKTDFDINQTLLGAASKY